MKTNNRQDSSNPLTDDRKVGVILMPLTIVDDVNLDNLLDEPGTPNGDLPIDDPKVIPPITPPITPPVNETPEQKAAREATEAANKVVADASKAAAIALATKYGGTDVNGVGDVVDSNGKVIKTKAEVDAAELVTKEAATAVEIDGAKYKLDDKGNAVKPDGTVFKTKAELDAMEAESDELPLVSEVIQKVGIQPLDDKGQPKVYEDSVEGIMALVNDIADVKLKASQKDLFTAHPKVEKYLKHIIAGGTDATFFNVVKNDYSKVVIDENNKEQQKQLLRADLLARGFTVEKADKYVKISEDGGELLADSKEALKARQTAQAALDKQVQDENDRRVAEQQDNAVKHWKQVEGIVTTGKVKNVVIPEVDRKAFYQYIAMAVDDQGNSQAALDAQEEDIETRLLTDFYRFKKYNLSALITDSANKERVKGLRARIEKDKGTGGGNTKPIVEPTTSAAGISLDTLLG